jgi:hypothetical protein
VDGAISGVAPGASPLSFFTTLGPGSHQISCEVQYVDASGTSPVVTGDATGSVNVMVSSILLPPTLSVKAETYTEIDLIWGAVTGALCYNLYWSTDGTNFTLKAAIVNTYADDVGLTAGATYYYYVTAVSSGCTTATSSPSNTVSVTLQSTYNVTVTPNSSSVMAGGAPSSDASTTVAVVVKDQNGNAVPNRAVQLSVSGTFSGGAAMESAGSVGQTSLTTDNTGTASTTYLSGADAGTVILTASVAGPSSTIQTATGTITTALPSASITFANGWEAGLSIQPVESYALPTTITVMYDGSPVVGLTIELLTQVYLSGGIVDVTGVQVGFDNSAPTTDSNGNCNVNLLWSGPVSSIVYTIMCTVDDPSVNVSPAGTSSP